MTTVMVSTLLLVQRFPIDFTSGSIQLFDLTTAIELSVNADPLGQSVSGGPSAADLLKMLDRCEFAATSGLHQQFLSSRCPTPCCTVNNTTMSTVNYTSAAIASPAVQRPNKDDQE
jgi:hypothetical protein